MTQQHVPPTVHDGQAEFFAPAATVVRTVPLTAAPPPFGWCLPCIINQKMAARGYGQQSVQVAQAVTLVSGTASCYEHIGVDLGPEISGDSPPVPGN